MTSSSDEGEDNIEEKKDNKALVGVVHSRGQKTYEDYSYGKLGSIFIYKTTIEIPALA